MRETFKPGDRVTVKLSDNHELDGSKLHLAKFVRAHIGSDWIDVELEEKHAGGVKMLSVPGHVVALRPL